MGIASSFSGMALSEFWKRTLHMQIVLRHICYQVIRLLIRCDLFIMLNHAVYQCFIIIITDFPMCDSVRARDDGLGWWWRHQSQQVRLIHTVVDRLALFDNNRTIRINNNNKTKKKDFGQENDIKTLFWLTLSHTIYNPWP